MPPSKIVVHYVECSFTSPTSIIKEDNILSGTFMIIGHDAPVCVSAFKQVLFAILSLLSLNKKPVVFFFVRMR